MAKKSSAFFAVVVSLFLITLVGFVFTLTTPLPEALGAQGGEMVQLAAGHVPTEEDVEEARLNARQVRKEIIDMTGYW